MTATIPNPPSLKPVHDWLRKINIAFSPGPRTPLLDEFARSLLACFNEYGHKVQDKPQNPLDVLLTTTTFGQPVGWRKSILAHARKRFSLEQTPTVVNLLHITSSQLENSLSHFQAALQKYPPDPQDFTFPGLEPKAYQTLYEQGQRGGPILALERMVQAQAVCLRNILVVGEDQPLEAYTFDLVGAYPRSDASDLETFYPDLVQRIVTAVSTQEISRHQTSGDPVPASIWHTLPTPGQMKEGGRQLGLRNFFTDMVSIANLVNVPFIPETVASQYSEGCFATWEPALPALVTTITGSARPVSKYNLGDDDLALITGVRPDGLGALVRPVQGLRNDPPSSEAVELMLMDEGLPRVALGPEYGYAQMVHAPVARSKLHGHRGVRSFNPHRVEHVHLEEPFYHYPVSCGSQAQAQAVYRAFSRSAALQDPGDPRQLVFTVLPGHGLMLAEKWAPGKVPFQLIWEAMDAGDLEIDRHIPQGALEYSADESGMMVLQE